MSKNKYPRGMVFFPKASISAFDSLTPGEIGTLIIKGKKLFELMDLTEKAKDYLSYLPDLQEVIEKW